MVTVNKATLGTPPKPELKANTRARTSFTVTWDAVPNAVGYTATATPSSGTAVTGTVSTLGTKPEAVFTGLTTNTAYTVTVMATGDANYAISAPSDGLRVVTLPAEGVASTKVTNLQVTPGDRSLMVSWTAATVAPHGYSVRWRYTDAGPYIGETMVMGTSYTIRRGLLNGETYEVVVETRNSANDGVETGTEVKAEGTPSGLDLVPSTLTSVVEGGSATYTVRLTTEPTGNVTVTPMVPDDTDVTVSPSSLPFTTSNWDTAQTVTVSAAEDPDAAADPPVTITHSTSGGGFDSMTAGSVEVIITENDTRGVTLSAETLTVKEGESGIYTVKLDTQPTGDVTVTVNGATGDVSVDTSTDTGNQNTLTFTDSNWNTAQTVTVAAAEDDDAVADDEVTLTHAVTGADYGSVMAESVEVTITEKDTPGASADQGRQMWLAHFSHTTTELALGGVTQRLVASRTPGPRVVLAGQALDGGRWSEAGTGGPFSDSFAGLGRGGEEAGVPDGERTMTVGEALAASRFTVTGEADETGAGVALWGQVMQSRFESGEGGDRCGRQGDDGAVGCGLWG